MRRSASKGLRLLAAAAGIAGATFCTSASAIVWFSPVTGFEDDDLAWVCRDIACTSPLTSGTLEEGMYVQGVIEFNTSYSVLPPGSSAPIGPAQELTGSYSLLLVDKTEIGVGSGIFNYTFAPAGADGTIISLYLDDSPDLNTVAVNCTSYADCLAKATDGASWATLGFDGDVNNAFLVSGMGDDIGDLLGAASTVTVGSENFFLNILTNNTGQTFGTQDCTSSGCPAGGDNAVQVIGGGALKGGQGLANGAVTRSDVDAQVAPIPEPGALALIAGGLLAAAGIGRRRKS